MANAADLRVKISGDVADIRRNLGLLRGDFATLKTTAAASAPNTASWSKGLTGIRQQVLDVAAAYLSWRAIGGIVRGVFDSFDKMDRIDEMGQMVALSAEDLSKFAYAAQFSGVELEALGKGFSFFQRNLSKNGELLGKLGVNAPDLIGKLRQIMDVFKQLPDGPEKASLAAEVFGSKLGGNLIPLLNEGADGFDRLSGEAERTGNVFDQAAVEGAAKFNDNMDTLKSTMTGVFNVAAQQLAPSIAAYAGAANDAAQESSAAAEGGKFLATVFKVVATGGIIVKNVVEAVVAVLAFLADAAIANGKIIITSLGGAFTVVGETMKAFMTGGPLAAFATFAGQVKKNGAAILGEMRGIRNQASGSVAALRGGFADASSDIANAFVAAFADVDTASASAKQAIGEVGDEADTASKKGEALRKMLASLFAEGGGKSGSGKSSDKAKEAIAGLVDQSALALDQVDRDLDALEQRFEDGQVKLADYFAARQSLELQRIDLKLAEAQADAAAATSTEQQSRALTELIKLQRDRAAIGPQTARDQAKAEKEAAAATLEALQAKRGNITGDLSATEGSISAQMSAGALGYAEGERQLQAVRQATIAQLVALRREQAAYVATLQPGDPGIIAAQQGLQGISTELANIAASMDAFGQDVEGGAFSAMRGLFTSIREEGTLTVDALKSAIGNFAASIYDSITGEWAQSIASTARGFFGDMLGGASEGAAEATAATTAATIQTTAAVTAATTVTTGASAAGVAITTGAATAGGTLVAAGSTMAATIVAAAIQAAAIMQAQATASSFASAAGSAKGNVFSSSGVHAFAKGGAFTNRLFSVPTFFQFGQGGQFGVMGEAGPEAVMPLERGSDGKLGVRNNGGGASAPASVVVVFGQDELATALSGRAGEQMTIAHVRNNWRALNGGG